MIRTIGKLIRGAATPFQLFSACVLGALLGFMPGFSQAPGLVIFITLSLIMLNANLALAAICAGLAKLLALALTPVTFSVGHWLLDGPLPGLFRWAINAPVLALFGFDDYTVTGGLLLGLVAGALARKKTNWASRAPGCSMDSSIALPTGAEAIVSRS